MITNRTAQDLAELARICLTVASGTRDEAAAAQLRQMADDFRERAAALDRDQPIEQPAAVARGTLSSR